jgi:hypothetical protein
MALQQSGIRGEVLQQSGIRGEAKNSQTGAMT